MTNVIQFGAIFSALGCELNISPSRASLEVVDTPKKYREEVINALEDISKFEFTANFYDGMAAIPLAQYVDEEPNPVNHLIRGKILETLGIVKEGRFISQYLAQQKTNRAWHISEKPNQCTFFGDVCINRGIQTVPGKRGRKSTRAPDQYHILNKSGAINREQLVTHALEKLVESIPTEKLISTAPTADHSINFERLTELKPEKLDELMIKIQELRKERVSV